MSDKHKELEIQYDLYDLKTLNDCNLSSKYDIFNLKRNKSEHRVVLLKFIVM